MPTFKWSILVCTIGQRDQRFKRLWAELKPQLAGKEVEVLAYWNNGEKPLSGIRQSLVEESRGEYISFIDDDDLIPKDYVDVIYPLLDGVDYIGFQLQLYHNGETMKPTFHSLEYDRWHEDDQGYYRNISHLNPIKRSLVLETPFVTESGQPEDADWAQRIAPRVKTQHYVDKVMYFYHHNTEDSFWRGDLPIGAYQRPRIRHQQFRWHPNSKEVWDGFSPG